MDPCLENFISQNWGRQMTTTKTRFFSALLSMVLLTRPVYAGEPRDPILPDESPFDWQCTYPFTETNCGEVIASWAEDYLDDPSDVSEDVVGCGQCTAIYATDWNGDQWTVGYRCENRRGYEVVTDDLKSKIPLYREGNSKQGWAVEDWAMFPCVRTWQCYDGCTWDRGEPACFVVMVVSVGRFQPVLGEPCDRQGGVGPDVVQHPEGTPGFDPENPFGLDLESATEPKSIAPDDIGTGSRWY